MFDNQTPNTTPPNLPVGEPDDMFAGSDSSAMGADFSSPPNVSLPTEPAPMVPSALDAGVLKPRSPLPPSIPVADEDMEGMDLPDLPPLPTVATPTAPVRQAPSLNPTMPPAQTGAMRGLAGLGQGAGMNAPMNTMAGTPPDNMLRDPMGGRKVWVTLMVVLSLGVVSAAGAWVYFTYINPSSSPVVPSLPVATTTPNTTPTENTETTEQTNGNASSTDSRILFGEPTLDTDSDGLDDEYEKKIGTDMLLWDTDSDTLSDGDEVLTWKTDPKKNDTDGDTYPDGMEIRNGYNPRGDGKLFPTPTSTSATAATATTTK